MNIMSENDLNKIDLVITQEGTRSDEDPETEMPLKHLEPQGDDVYPKVPTV